LLRTKAIPRQAHGHSESEISNQTFSFRVYILKKMPLEEKEKERKKIGREQKKGRNHQLCKLGQDTKIL
jgi:hypothetical protein